MGPSSPDQPEFPFPAERPPTDRYYTPPVPVRRRRDRPWVHALLLLLTLVTTTIVGGSHYASFAQNFAQGPLPLSSAEFYLNGLWYSVSILAILGCHELGHYYACRYYGVDASIPYFLPAPLPLTGTLGAFIRIRQPIPGKRELFDIGIAGPIAGFMVAVPVLFLGINMSRVALLPPETSGFVELGEPLLFKAVSWLVWDTPPEGYSINMHPMAFAAWFGLLATALNLFPIGQLDGGHISYAVLGSKSTVVTLVTVACLMGLTFISTSWLVWTVLTVVMLLTFGPRHPRTVDEEVPLDRTRLGLAVFAAIMFVLCFTPTPIQPLDLVGR
jgi:membrane-associated protease RseP (regulator of RpoE activity)